MNFLKNLQKLVVGEFFEDQSSSNNSNLQPKKYSLNNLQIQEDKLLSEGGYGYVWKAHNVNNKQEVFAVKRMICQGKQKEDLAKRELEILYKLPQHDNLVRFIDGDILQEDQSTSQAVFVMEYCPDGTLFNLMESRQKSGGFTEKEIIHIILQICKGLQVLHSINITHRDLKIENVLLKDGMFKLCDFGSASTDVVDLSKLDRKQQSEQEELYERYTTLQSRPPEMCDVFSEEIIDSKVDIWMLGCIVYCLCFYIHPFYEASKLAIISASYKFKQNSKYNEKMHDFIRHLLTPSPKYRPKIEEVINILENWDNLQEIPLNVINFLLIQSKSMVYKQEQAKQTKQQEQQFEQDMKVRDEKVKQMIEKNRQQRIEEEQRKKLQAEADNAFNQFNHNQNTSTQKVQKVNKDMQEIDEFDGWGEFQKADEVNKKDTKEIINTLDSQIKEDDIDFNSFEPNNQNQSVDKNDFDFGQFYKS
ncbi:Serine/Threonine kinase domain protein (macronuclear) [Tetrahymena thermophila SB210]|uniref:non-specific serine/threonine protein kinase n=1 Tax=Tetrahymena thermophila (strain SB210) TaxID=312017 RepID=I7LTK2_TETTS|nr:Serine/Threonine kinase domain protein [Tetrahymena thermophila SB210]EAR85402.2 Serine/Threonine kinase domain protein [Tetrahymena thermophila SB210]|eukprot:XP_001033065.2 Serine/Threonine kinase domain protein [Tetrahymena thermophila SB210]